VYPTVEKRLGAIVRWLSELTREAGADMVLHEPSSAERAEILSRWERHLGGVRTEYLGLDRAIRSCGDHGGEQKDALLKRLKGLAKQMVLDRSLLEGLSRGEGPSPNQAGGAFPPSCDVPESLRTVVEALVEDGVREIQAVAEQSPPGELLAGFVARCSRPLDATLQRVESKLKAHEGESERLLSRLGKELRSALGAAVRRRGETEADRIHRVVTERLHQSLFQALEKFRRDVDLESVDEMVRRLDSWSRERLETAEAELTAASISPSLSEELVWFQRELSARTGEVKGWWDGPPDFEKIYREDLDPRVMSGPPADSDGVYAEFYSDGHLRRVVLMSGGKESGEIRVWPDLARARYEDSANVAEFRPDGVIEEYGGRYERETKARLFFRDWVLQKLEEMVNRTG